MDVKRIRIRGKYFYAVRDAKGRFKGTFKKKSFAASRSSVVGANLVKFYLVVDYETDEAAGHDLKLEFYAVGKKGSINEFEARARELLEEHFGESTTDKIMEFATFGEEEYVGGPKVGINEAKSDARFLKGFRNKLVRGAGRWKL